MVFLVGCVQKSIPWKSILVSMPNYAIIVSNITSDWGAYTLLTNIPTYISEVLKFDIASVSINQDHSSLCSIDQRVEMSYVSLTTLLNTSVFPLSNLLVAEVGWVGSVFLSQFYCCLLVSPSCLAALVPHG